MKTRRYKHLPNLVAWKEHPDGPWFVGTEAGKMNSAFGYMIRRQRNQGWNSAYWKIYLYGKYLSFEVLGTMDRAMIEIKNRSIKK